MAREHMPVSLTAGSAVMSGPLGSALTKHARERMVHFFLFLFALDAACRRANTLAGRVVVDAADAFSVKATHQVDAGYRSTNLAHDNFDAHDPAVVTQPATIFRSMDASHFCNLGLRPTAVAELATRATADRDLFDLLDLARRLAGNTRLLPQRVNIGPDRIIDVAHGVLARQLLRAHAPVISTINLARYLTHVTSTLVAYRTKKVAGSEHGLAACCDAYLGVYALGAAQPYRTLLNYVWAECQARDGVLSVSDYLVLPSP